ncbi:MAG: sel1 repeat family protein [Proteobacteria bacterium]|nr:sel1 repeat family protein [Pseudomonadota bacterium]
MNSMYTFRRSGIANYTILNGLISKPLLNKEDIDHFKKVLDEYNKDKNFENSCQLADCYMSGIGVEIDLKKAIRLFLKPAKQNMPEAQEALGYAYDRAGDHFNSYIWFTLLLTRFYKGEFVEKYGQEFILQTIEEVVLARKCVAKDLTDYKIVKAIHKANEILEKM